MFGITSGICRSRMVSSPLYDQCSAEYLAHRIYFNIYLLMNKFCAFTKKKSNNLVIMKDKFWSHNITLWRDIKASGGFLYSGVCIQLSLRPPPLCRSQHRSTRQSHSREQMVSSGGKRFGSC